MRLKKIGENALQWLFTNYLKWIERTVTIRWDEENRYGDSQIFGFWHEDSFFMNLVLENLAHKTRPVTSLSQQTREGIISNIWCRDAADTRCACRMDTRRLPR